MSLPPRDFHPQTGHRKARRRSSGNTAVIHISDLPARALNRPAASQGTVEHHLASIYGKLGVPGRAGAIAYALREGIA